MENMPKITPRTGLVVLLWVAGLGLFLYSLILPWGSWGYRGMPIQFAVTDITEINPLLYIPLVTGLFFAAGVPIFKLATGRGATILKRKVSLGTTVLFGGACVLVLGVLCYMWVLHTMELGYGLFVAVAGGASLVAGGVVGSPPKITRRAAGRVVVSLLVAALVVWAVGSLGSKKIYPPQPGNCGQGWNLYPLPPKYENQAVAAAGRFGFKFPLGGIYYSPDLGRWPGGCFSYRDGSSSYALLVLNSGTLEDPVFFDSTVIHQLAHINTPPTIGEIQDGINIFLVVSSLVMGSLVILYAIKRRVIARKALGILCCYLFIICPPLLFAGLPSELYAHYYRGLAGYWGWFILYVLVCVALAAFLVAIWWVLVCCGRGRLKEPHK